LGVLLFHMIALSNLIHVHRSAIEQVWGEIQKWLLPIVTLFLILANSYWIALDGASATAIASALILLTGIPHGTLDVEIAAQRFRQHGVRGQVKIIFAYISCAAMMTLLWAVLPSLALILFLGLSIIHFGADWRTDGDEFFALTVGWTLISLPALSIPRLSRQSLRR
jgi:beta-carotene 15,15'-dioxygenase